MKSTYHADLLIPSLPMAARRAHIVPELTSHSLVSIGTLCDAGCDVNFTTTTVTVRHNNAIVMSGTRTPPGLWQFAIPASSAPTPPLHDDAMALSTIGYPNASELVAHRGRTHPQHPASTHGSSTTNGSPTASNQPTNTSQRTTQPAPTPPPQALGRQCHIGNKSPTDPRNHRHQ
jgi:hypothetical protein